MIVVDYLKALDDGTWETETFEVPADDADADVEHYLQRYAREHLATQEDYQDVLFWGVYEWEAA